MAEIFLQEYFYSKNAVSCVKLGYAISAIDFEVTTDNQHVDSSIVTHINIWIC